MSELAAAAALDWGRLRTGWTGLKAGWRASAKLMIRKGMFQRAARCLTACLMLTASEGEGEARTVEVAGGRVVDEFALALCQRTPALLGMGCTVRAVIDAATAARMAPLFPAAWFRLGQALWIASSSNACFLEHFASALNQLLRGAPLGSLKTRLGGAEEGRPGELGDARRVAAMFAGLAERLATRRSDFAAVETSKGPVREESAQCAVLRELAASAAYASFAAASSTYRAESLMEPIAVDDVGPFAGRKRRKRRVPADADGARWSMGGQEPRFPLLVRDRGRGAVVASADVALGRTLLSEDPVVAVPRLPHDDAEAADGPRRADAAASGARRRLVAVFLEAEARAAASGDDTSSSQLVAWASHLRLQHGHLPAALRSLIPPHRLRRPGAGGRKDAWPDGWVSDLEAGAPLGLSLVDSMAKEGDLDGRRDVDAAIPALHSVVEASASRFWPNTLSPSWTGREAATPAEPAKEPAAAAAVLRCVRAGPACLRPAAGDEGADAFFAGLLAAAGPAAAAAAAAASDGVDEQGDGDGSSSRPRDRDRASPTPHPAALATPVDGAPGVLCVDVLSHVTLQQCLAAACAPLGSGTPADPLAWASLPREARLAVLLAGAASLDRSGVWVTGASRLDDDAPSRFPSPRIGAWAAETAAAARMAVTGHQPAAAGDGGPAWLLARAAALARGETPPAEPFFPALCAACRNGFSIPAVPALVAPRRPEPAAAAGADAGASGADETSGSAEGAAALIAVAEEDGAPSPAPDAGDAGASAARPDADTPWAARFSGTPAEPGARADALAALARSFADGTALPQRDCGSAVFTLAAMLDHSCRPSATVSFGTPGACAAAAACARRSPLGLGLPLPERHAPLGVRDGASAPVAGPFTLRVVADVGSAMALGEPAADSDALRRAVVVSIAYGPLEAEEPSVGRRRMAAALDHWFLCRCEACEPVGGAGGSGGARAAARGAGRASAATAGAASGSACGARRSVVRPSGGGAEVSSEAATVLRSPFSYGHHLNAQVQSSGGVVLACAHTRKVVTDVQARRLVAAQKAASARLTECMAAVEGAGRLVAAVHSAVEDSMNLDELTRNVGRVAAEAEEGELRLLRAVVLLSARCAPTFCAVLSPRSSRLVDWCTALAPVCVALLLVCMVEPASTAGLVRAAMATFALCISSTMVVDLASGPEAPVEAPFDLISAAGLVESSLLHMLKSTADDAELNAKLRAVCSSPEVWGRCGSLEFLGRWCRAHEV